MQDLKTISYIVHSHGYRTVIDLDTVIIQIPLEGGGSVYKPVSTRREAYEVLGYE